MSLIQKPSIQWTSLCALSLCCAGLFEFCHLPAALLLGPMAAAIAIAASGGNLRVPRIPFSLAQSIVGCMIARSITPAIIRMMMQHWLLFLSVTFSVTLISNGLGWLLARSRALPGGSAIWGSSPGGATAMTLMAEASGEDARLVAFMQYLRVVLVTVAATLVARIWITPGQESALAINWFPAINWLPLGQTLLLTAACTYVARLLRVPAGALLVPLIAAAVLQCGLGMVIDLPPWLLAASYALIGWSIGLRFDRAILAHVARVWHRVALSIVTLIAICGGIACLLNQLAGIDPLTAYLATSPGGVDSVSIIAASAKVDIPFVMALQTARLFVVMLCGPSVARLVHQWCEPPGQTS